MEKELQGKFIRLQKILTFVCNVFVINIFHGPSEHIRVHTLEFFCTTTGPLTLPPQTFWLCVWLLMWHWEHESCSRQLLEGAVRCGSGEPAPSRMCTLLLLRLSKAAAHTKTRANCSHFKQKLPCVNFHLPTPPRSSCTPAQRKPREPPLGSCRPRDHL